MSESEKANGNEVGTGKKLLFVDDEDDIFKSALESPMTDTDRTIQGDDEIDLNDEDEFPSTKTVKFTESDEEDIFGEMNPAVVPTTMKKDGVEKMDPQKAYQEIPQPGQSTTQHMTHSNETGAKIPFEMRPENKNTIRIGQEDARGGGDEEGQYLEITVTEPQKQGEGMSGFMVYRVTTRTNIALFRRKEFAVWRRFSDFLGLHSKLAEKHVKKGRIVPPAPEKNVIGTTKIKITAQGDSNPSANNHTDFIEKRRATLERFLNRCAAHPTLRVDPDYRDFLEIDSDLPKATSTSAFSGAGFVRLFNKVGETVNKISYKMDESDQWFEEKVQNIDALEAQLRKVHTSIELLVLNRRELAVCTGSFAKSAAVLSNSEEHTGLARALAQLAEVEEKVEQAHSEQANSDFFLFSELLKDYIALIGSVKDVFHERVKTYQTWQHAQQMLNKKREAKAKMEVQGKNDRLAQAREEVVEWESKVERSQEEFNSISAIIKKELELFETARVKEFKRIIVKYLESLFSHQTELAKHWETFLPEAKCIV